MKSVICAVLGYIPYSYDKSLSTAVPFASRIKINMCTRSTCDFNRNYFTG